VGRAQMKKLATAPLSPCWAAAETGPENRGAGPDGDGQGKRWPADAQVWPVQGPGRAARRVRGSRAKPCWAARQLEEAGKHVGGP